MEEPLRVLKAIAPITSYYYFWSSPNEYNAVKFSIVRLINIYLNRMEITEEKQNQLEYEKLSKTVKILRPFVFKRGDQYLCLLGPDQQSGIAGYGESVLEAIHDWEVHLVMSIMQNKNSPIVKQAKQLIRKSNRKV